MKVLRLVLILGGLALVVWGVLDYINAGTNDDTSDALPKILLGILGGLASLLAKSRR